MRTIFGDDRDWFFAARLGLFVHWGLYALDGWHEQEHLRLGSSRTAYRAKAARFAAQSFDPDAWIDLAEDCGMEYLVVTAKHIDGFCLFRSQASSFTVAGTPAGEDLIGRIAAACHRRNFPLGLYFSALDNLDPCYPRAGRSHESPAESGDRPDLDAYLATLRTQVEELCTHYGPLKVFWWDANRTGVVDPSINALIRRLQPACVINDRGFDEGDFGTPEREYQPDGEALPFARPTEACESVGSQSWGYRVDEDYFTPRYLMTRIDLMMARGANYLLNFGPDGQGAIPAEAARILRRVGTWYRAVRQAFDGTELATGLTTNRDVLLTRRGRTVWVHLNREPRTGAVALPPLAVLPERAELLNTGERVACDLNRLPSLYAEPGPTCLRLYDLPVERLAGEVLVVRLDFARELTGNTGPP